MTTFGHVSVNLFTSFSVSLTICPLLASDRLGQPTGHFWPEDSTCLAWLDQQPVHSVTYVAFGSTTIFTECQFNEIAHGLELVDQPYLWVWPDLTRELITSFPDGFRDGVTHLGKLVAWAPQQKGLAHRSIACFLTHCGWNLTIEGLSLGVPLLCWPYSADQFHNQNFICDTLNVGLRLHKDKNGIITRDEIKVKVQKIYSDEQIRSRANKVKDMAKRHHGLASPNQPRSLVAKTRPFASVFLPPSAPKASLVKMTIWATKNRCFRTSG
ncbi:hypothetical protein IFM89_023961 [Coptis chinensis]|uniref:Uncharacterized protein n=1 Tax=Coptis chinensis TaxID=261450 RepID=A0A835LR83_9MAGN|nr:hypothetical protein IFM89_023961 [Coptis chinensis]